MTTSCVTGSLTLVFHLRQRGFCIVWGPVVPVLTSIWSFRIVNFEMLEEELLKKAMEKANNVQEKAARLLNMNYKTFYNRWEKYNQE